MACSMAGIAPAGKRLWQVSGMQVDEMLRNHWRSSKGHAGPADDSVRVCFAAGRRAGCAWFR